MVSLLEGSTLERRNSVVNEIYERPNESSSCIYPNFEEPSKISFHRSYPHQLLERTNSVVNEIYERPNESSSSIYPDFERTLKINFRRSYLHKLLESLLPFSFQSSSTINLNTILNAVNWIIELRKIVGLNSYWWSEPLVNAFDSELVFEWWHGGKKITMYFSEANAEFIKVWGADIDSEMEDGTAKTNEQIESLWQWLAS